MCNSIYELLHTRGPNLTNEITGKKHWLTLCYNATHMEQQETSISDSYATFVFVKLFV